jgi:hypothetical protein
MDLKTQNSEVKSRTALIMRVRFIKLVQWKQNCVQICLNIFTKFIRLLEICFEMEKILTCRLKYISTHK